MKRILFVLSEYGYWGEELVGSLESLINVTLILVGDSEPIINMIDLIRIFYNDKPFTTECYNRACLVLTRDYWPRKNLISGKHMTEYHLEYDYKNGTGFFWGVDFNTGSPPYTFT